ncbi:hypothetical protein CLV92_104112 [Kineococcus xinjiangensis]|uniref:Uncharacterized protein n=1 Tax=Kineococcus xinjiangensis TaxID=512762 RepID=A0A2S6ISR2_9ACTN|nr:hypothetical protein [Kineococcus xinjiangensis]PPK97293.1 hypothetical protein CLV92_104112 [Kineococcus xinjiangensis]
MSAPEGRERSGGLDDEREVLLEDERSADDSDRGWGDEPGAGSGHDDERFLRDVPPHWG